MRNWQIVGFKFVIRDCWVGLFWKTDKPIPYPEKVCHCGDLFKNHGCYSGHSPVEYPEPIETTWYLCVLPFFPFIWKTLR